MLKINAILENKQSLTQRTHDDLNQIVDSKKYANSDSMLWTQNYSIATKRLASPISKFLEY